MGTIICGNLHLSNGKTPNISLESHGELTIFDKETVYYNCKILKGHIIIEFPETILEKDSDILFRTAGRLLDNVLLTKVLVKGIGLSYTIETLKTQNDEIIDATPDKAPSIDIQISQTELENILGRKSNLRYAIRDYNQGLINREDCPFYFYRTIETLAKSICDVDELTKKVWDEFHNKIGTSREDMKYLEEINQYHRHGEHTSFIEEQHIEMLKTVSFFLSKSMDFIINQKEES